MRKICALTSPPRQADNGDDLKPSLNGTERTIMEIRNNGVGNVGSDQIDLTRTNRDVLRE